MTTNICLAIKCPYAYKTKPESSYGCRRYTVALHCHLLGSYQDGTRNENLQSSSTQYYLYGNLSQGEIDRLRATNQEFLSSKNEVEKQDMEIRYLGCNRFHPDTKELVLEQT